MSIGVNFAILKDSSMSEKFYTKKGEKNKGEKEKIFAFNRIVKLSSLCR